MGTLSGTPCLGLKTSSLGIRVRYIPTASPQDFLASTALRHGAPRILGRVLLPSAAKKVGLDPPMPRLTLSYHINQYSDNAIRIIGYLNESSISLLLAFGILLAKLRVPDSVPVISESLKHSCPHL